LKLHKDPSTYLLLGKLFDKQLSFTQAIDSFNHALKLDTSTNPPKPTLFFHLGCTLEKAKEFKKAILNYKKCLTIDPKQFGACIHLANLLANVGEGQRAAKYFKHAIKIIGERKGEGVTQEGVVNAYFGLGKTL